MSKNDEYLQDVKLTEDRNYDPEDAFVIFFYNTIAKGNLAQLFETWKMELDKMLDNNNFFN